MSTTAALFALQMVKHERERILTVELLAFDLKVKLLQPPKLTELL